MVITKSKKGRACSMGVVDGGVLQSIPHFTEDIKKSFLKRTGSAGQIFATAAHFP